jgi:hypothetical protein
MLAGLSSCIKDRNYIEQAVDRIYRLDGIEVYGQPVEGLGPNDVAIQPLYTYSSDFDAVSRQYYAEVDTALMFSGNLIITNKNYYLRNWNLIDLRFVSVEVIALVNFDDKHPAGSSLNDFFSLSYWYKHSLYTIPVSDIEYGLVMLGDFFPSSEGFCSLPGLVLTFNGNESLDIPPIEVRITDAWGREFSSVINC